MIKVCLLALPCLFGCAQPQNPSVAATNASPAQSAQPGAPSANEIVYVDVRTAEEFATGHIKGALNIPYDQMETRWTEIAARTNQPLVVYCRSGRRSGIALGVLEKKGFANARNGGSLDALRKSGVPVGQ